MRPSTVVYEEVDRKLELRGSDLLGSHFPNRVAPNKVLIGETGITLTVDAEGGFHLHVPACQSARLLVRNTAQTPEGRWVTGNFAQLEVD
jgi:hypothetical protein